MQLTKWDDACMDGFVRPTMTAEQAPCQPPGTPLRVDWFGHGCQEQSTPQLHVKETACGTVHAVP